MALGSFMSFMLECYLGLKIFFLGLGRGEVECTADLLELVGEEVMECVRRQQEVGGEAGEVFSGAVYREEGVCIMIHRIVHKCGSMWSNCYTDTEVRGDQSPE